MANEKEVFKLDLDSKDFMAKAQGAQKALSEIAEVESFKKLTGMITSATPALIAVASAVYGVKKALDLTLEAESIKRVNAEFEALATSAGISANSLKEGLEKVADGLVDADDLLGIANKALVTMGKNAAKLPELFEVAKNSTLIFGGTLTQNFEALNQAIATGQTRMLRHLGIMVDSESAYRKYANSIGVTVGSLSDQEKKTALLNEVLEKSRNTFKNSSIDLNDATHNVQRLDVAIKELKQTFVMAFDRTMGPTVRNAMETLTYFAHNTTKVMKGLFGDTEEQTTYQIERTESKIKSLNNVLLRMESPSEGFWGKLFAPDEKARERIQGLIDQQEAKLEELKAKQAEAMALKPSGRAVAESEGPDSANYAKRLAEKSKFEASLAQLTLSRISAEEQVAISVEQVNALDAEKIVAIRQERDAKLQQLDAQRALQEIATDEELNLRKTEISARADAEIAKFQEEADDRRIQSLKRFAEYNKNTMVGFSAQMKVSAAEASASMHNFVNLAKLTTNSFKSNFTQAMKDVGDGTKSATEAMKGMFLGMIADIAESYGAMYIQLGIATFNPIQLAAGGALVAIASFLRSQAKSSSGGLGVSSGGGMAASGPVVPVIPGQTIGETMNAMPSLPPQAQRQVSINIMGHYFETPETRRMLVDMIRQEGDASQFTIQQIGQGA